MLELLGVQTIAHVGTSLGPIRFGFRYLGSEGRVSRKFRGFVGGING